MIILKLTYSHCNYAKPTSKHSEERNFFRGEDKLYMMQ